MTDLELVKAVRAKLTPPGSWIKQDFAQDDQGQGVHPRQPEASCWCLAGAAKSLGTPDAVRTLATALDFGPGTLLMMDWNDRPQTRHQDVLDRLDKAIAELSA